MNYSMAEIMQDSSKFLSSQNSYGFYDWFCSARFLESKANKLMKKVGDIIESKKIDINKQYIFFKNNCPMVGKLYDDFRICDIKTGDVIYTVIPKSGMDSEKGLAYVWGKDNNFKEAIISGTWKDIVKWFHS